jgi:hypothetical protein
VGRRVISKIKIGNMKLGGASRKAVGIFTGGGEKRSSGDPYVTSDAFGDGREGAMTPQRFSAGPTGPLESPNASGTRDQINSMEGGAFGLGATSIYPTPIETGSHTAFDDNEDQLQSPTSPVAAPLKKESKQGIQKFGSVIPTVKVPKKLFGTGGKESKPKHNRNSSETFQQQQSPKQKSMFSKFVNELSQAQLTVSKPAAQGQSGSPPPRPPDKSQFRSTSETSGGLKGFFADLSSRDITGQRKVDRRTSPQNPSIYSKSRFSGSDVNKTNSVGYSDCSERDQMGPRLYDENVYDEGAPDWESKLSVMKELLPHISRDVLASSLKEARGDEERAIGLAVLNSRT